jgi:two-component system, OmpR family, phosphate regulon sensor histidine kinase PhoR
LHVQVQNREGYILKSLLPFMVAMLVFTIIIVLTFGISIRTILKQKKLSTIKNDFINNMTHEFKTPIATINIAADALHSEGISTAQTQHFADIIKQESRSMNQKVETILQMALVEQQQVQLEKETIGANPLVQKTIQHLQLSLEASAAQLNVNYLPNDVNLCIDAHHVGNVLGNIIDNAIKYSQGAPHISIALAATNTMLTISIADKGIGMSKEEQKHVFDKFYRAQSGNIHNTKGFGLGLSYAREIVLLHKGQISIESEKGEGTTVTITLPIHGHNG